jgi:monofunctional glycosyltransferase
MRAALKRTLIWGPASVALVAVVAYLVTPWPVRLRWSDPESTSFMRYRVKEARARGEALEIRHEWVPLERISPEMVRAAITAEDGRFREHKGVDWLALQEELRYDGEPPFSIFDPGDLKAVARAAAYYRDNRNEVRGRSTITQQLAKNLYFTPERTLTRKVAEMWVAQRLEWFLSKDRILALYLNTVELGPGIFGVEAAAQEYFGRSAAGLSAYQAASLAGSLPHPLTSNPSLSPSRMAWRRDQILGRMGGRSADRSPVPVAPPPVEPPPVIPVATPDSVGGAPPGDPLPPPPSDTASPPPPLPDTAAPPPPPDTAPPPPPPDTVLSPRASRQRS